MGWFPGMLAWFDDQVNNFLNVDTEIDAIKKSGQYKLTFRQHIATVITNTFARRLDDHVNRTTSGNSELYNLKLPLGDVKRDAASAVFTRSIRDGVDFKGISLTNSPDYASTLRQRVHTIFAASALATVNSITGVVRIALAATEVGSLNAKVKTQNFVPYLRFPIIKLFSGVNILANTLGGLVDRATRPGTTLKVATNKYRAKTTPANLNHAPAQPVARNINKSGNVTGNTNLLPPSDVKIDVKHGDAKLPTPDDMVPTSNHYLLKFTYGLDGFITILAATVLTGAPLYAGWKLLALDYLIAKIAAAALAYGEVVVLGNDLYLLWEEKQIANSPEVNGLLTQNREAQRKASIPETPAASAENPEAAEAAPGSKQPPSKKYASSRDDYPPEGPDSVGQAVVHQQHFDAAGNLIAPPPAIVISNTGAAYSDALSPTGAQSGGIDTKAISPTAATTNAAAQEIKATLEAKNLGKPGVAISPRGLPAAEFGVDIEAPVLVAITNDLVTQPVASAHPQMDLANRLLANQDQLVELRHQMRAEADVKARAGVGAVTQPVIHYAVSASQSVRVDSMHAAGASPSHGMGFTVGQQPTIDGVALPYATAASPQSQPVAGQTPTSLNLSAPANRYQQPRPPGENSQSQRVVARGPNLTPTPITPQYPQPQPLGNLPVVRGLTPSSEGGTDNNVTQNISFASRAAGYFTTAVQIARSAVATVLSTRVARGSISVPVQLQATVAGAASVDQKIQAIQAGNDDKRVQHGQIQQLRASAGAANSQPAAATSNAAVAARNSMSRKPSISSMLASPSQLARDAEAAAKATAAEAADAAQNANMPFGVDVHPGPVASIAVDLRAGGGSVVAAQNPQALVAPAGVVTIQSSGDDKSVPQINPVPKAA